MLTTRVAGLEDAALIGLQRRRMFVDAGQPDDARMQAMVEQFVPWVREKLSEGSYLGWLAVAEDGLVVGGSGMWLMDFPPHFLHVEPGRGYLLNFYVAPEFRGQGIARSLLQKALAEARRRRLAVVTLHASKFGRPLYEQTGFKPTNEMMLRLEGDAEDKTRD